MTRIVLIRSGETEWDRQKRLQGSLSVPLDDRGRDRIQLQLDGLRHMKLGVIFCGPEAPSCQTADIIGLELKKPVRRVRAFRNIDLGLWQGLVEEEVRHKHPKAYKRWLEDPLSVCPPCGETIHRAYERVKCALQQILRRRQNGVVGIVSGDIVAALIRCHVKGLGPQKVWEAHSSDGDVEILEAAARSP